MRGHVRTRSGLPSPGVLVSDGVTVTTTAHDGSFTLDPRGPFVFITRPAATACENWFVRAGAASVEFILDADEDVFPHRFVHISDTHLGAGPLYPQPVEIGDEEVFTRFLTRLPELEPGLRSVIATGDLTDLGLDEEYAALRAAVDASPLPLHLLPGNHDHLNGTVTGLVSRTGYALHGGDPSGYERHIGPGPAGTPSTCPACMSSRWTGTPTRSGWTTRPRMPGSAPTWSRSRPARHGCC